MATSEKGKKKKKKKEKVERAVSVEDEDVRVGARHELWDYREYR